MRNWTKINCKPKRSCCSFFSPRFHAVLICSTKNYLEWFFAPKRNLNWGEYLENLKFRLVSENLPRIKLVKKSNFSSANSNKIKPIQILAFLISYTALVSQSRKGHFCGFIWPENFSLWQNLGIFQGINLVICKAKCFLHTSQWWVSAARYQWHRLGICIHGSPQTLLRSTSLAFCSLPSPSI